jgi:hypothetical protein
MYQSAESFVILRLKLAKRVGMSVSILKIVNFVQKILTEEKLMVI